MSRLRVLFVCLGNSCRSQMAEGYARAYGGDVMEAASAGLAPAASVAAMTVAVMRERNIELGGHFPKSIQQACPTPADLMVNMSGYPLPPAVRGKVREWAVRDPIGEPAEVYREVATQIERLVMQLILELRNQPREERPRRRSHLGDPRPRS